MSKTPFVSICSITYNHAPYIRQCLDSMLMQQTNFEFEIIINDDCSTDGTTEIIREYAIKYPEIIKPIFHNENEYQKGTRGMYIKYVFPKTQGKYIALCDGDDYWIDPLKLQKQVDYLEAHNNCGLVHTLAKCYIQEKNVYSESLLGRDVKDYETLFHANTICTLTTCFRKDLLDRALRDITWKSSWAMVDLPIWLYIAFHSNIHFLNEITGVYRFLSESASHSHNIDRRIAFFESAYEISTYFAAKYHTRHLLPKRESRIIYLEMCEYINNNIAIPVNIIKKIKLSMPDAVKLYTICLASRLPSIRGLLRHTLIK